MSRQEKVGEVFTLAEFFGPMAKTLCCSKWTRTCSAKQDPTDSGLAYCCS